MIHRIYIKVFIGLLALYSFCSSCKKYLEARPDKRLAVISTLQDLQSLMEVYFTINQRDIGALEACADNYYVTDEVWKARSEYERNMYVWKGDHEFRPINEGSNDWGNSYDKVYIANTVLEGIKNVEKTITNEKDWNNTKGEALFIRAKTFFEIVLTWANAYNENTAGEDLGIPLRLNPDFNKKSSRSTVEETYNQIIRDLKTSAQLLPDKSSHVLYASKPAAYGLLARVYLSMREYDSCFKYSDLYLKEKHPLLNYNILDTAATFPFAPQFSCLEIIYDSELNMPPMLWITRVRVDTTLYSSYSINDLRKSIYFKLNDDGSHAFKGSYYGSATLWSGIATDEVYLMRAECYARKGMATKAMSDLNTLLINRWKTGTFIPFTANTKKEALDLILTERRKELLFRGLRWMDIKRLNMEGRNIILKRMIDGQTYTLPPNDLRYALPIPEDIIKLAGIQQNPR